MPINIKTQIGSVLTGLIANTLGDKLESQQEKNAIKRFGEELQDWADQFKISDQNDGSVLITDAFAKCESWNAPLKEIVNYVFVPRENMPPESTFLDGLYTNMVTDIQEELDKALILYDAQLIRDFLKKLLEKTKNFLSSDEMREIRQTYLMCQANAKLDKLLEGGIPGQPDFTPPAAPYQPPKYRLSSNNLTARDYFLEGSREEELSTLSNALETEQEVFIWGLGGMGKSMLALKLVERLGREAYRLQYRDSMENTLLKLTFADGTREYRYQPQSGLTPEEQKRAELRERLTMLKESHGDALFIVDNFDTEDRNVNALLAEEACQNLRDLGVKLIYTTRCPCGEKWAELRPLSGDGLLKVMEQITQHAYPADALRSLIEAVHGHTLMVVLMARTLHESYGDVTPETILTALKEHTVSEADFPEVHSHKNRNFLEAQLYAHMKALFDLTNVAGPARNVLRCAALLPDGGMAGDLFQNCVGPVKSEERKWVKKLEKTGWLARSGDLLTIHPVVREVCLEELKPDMVACGPFLNELSDQYVKTRYNDYNPVRYRQIADCFACAARLLKDDKTGEWALRAGFLYNRLGDYRAALEQDLKAVALREEALPPNHPDLATPYSNMGYAYNELGDYNKALEYQKKALDILERIAPNHPNLAGSYNNMGNTYSALGNHNKALEYRKKVLVIVEGIPIDPIHLVICYDNIGTTYCALGNHNKALEYQKKALKIWEQKHLPDHPDLATIYNNVGYTYGELSKHDKALEYKEKSLEIRRRVLLPNHPELAVSYNNVGSTYLILGMREKKQGKEEKAAEYLEKALGCMKQALEILEQKLPPYYPHLRGCRENIAIVYLEMGDMEQFIHWLALAEATPPPPGAPAP